MMYDVYHTFTHPLILPYLSAFRPALRCVALRCAQCWIALSLSLFLPNLHAPRLRSALLLLLLLPRTTAQRKGRLGHLENDD